MAADWDDGWKRPAPDPGIPRAAPGNSIYLQRKFMRKNFKIKRKSCGIFGDKKKQEINLPSHLLRGCHCKILVGLGQLPNQGNVTHRRPEIFGNSARRSAPPCYLATGRIFSCDPGESNLRWLQRSILARNWKVRRKCAKMRENADCTISSSLVQETSGGPLTPLLKLVPWLASPTPYQSPSNDLKCR